MTKSCVKVWVKKMSSDYSTFLRDAKESLISKRSDVKGKKDGIIIQQLYNAYTLLCCDKLNIAKSTTYASEMELYKSIESDMKALELPAKPKDSPVWQAIDAAYPADIEV